MTGLLTVDAPHRVSPPRLLPSQPANLTAHLQVHGPVPTGLDVIRLAAESGLTGHGGAGFPVGRKLAAVAEAASGRGRGPAVVVANGSEGEPASLKDKTLLQLAPHLVLDGLRLAAEAVGAERGYLALEQGTGLARALTAAVAARGDRVRVAEVPGRFLSGESSALISFLDGGPALPRYPVPPVRERGIGGAPTLVQNVETLAQLALIARHGPAWFRSVGTPAEPGTMLCTVHGPETRPQVVEAALGTPLERLLGRDHGPVLVGGYHGSWVPAEQTRVARLGEADLGVPLGAGVLIALPGDRCGLAQTAGILGYLALQSAGQCGPCLNGLPRIASAFGELADPGQAARSPRLLDDLARWSGLVDGRGACHHPDGTVRLVRSALTVFAAEAQAHEQGWCSETGGHRAPMLRTAGAR